MGFGDSRWFAEAMDLETQRTEHSALEHGMTILCSHFMRTPLVRAGSRFVKGNTVEEIPSHFPDKDKQGACSHATCKCRKVHGAE